MTEAEKAAVIKIVELYRSAEQNVYIYGTQDERTVKAFNRANEVLRDVLDDKI